MRNITTLLLVKTLDQEHTTKMKIWQSQKSSSMLKAKTVFSFLKYLTVKNLEFRNKTSQAQVTTKTLVKFQRQLVELKNHKWNLSTVMAQD